MGCGNCNNERRKGHKFCSECGTPLAPAAPAASAERRQITVLFYDMVGSTELSAHSDPEDFREAIATFHRVASEAVREYDAFIGAHVGDGGIVYFGYPVAREDAAECAVLSGLALIKAIGKIRLPNGRLARARVGIATGTGVVGRIEDGDTGNSAVGHVTSLAARLQSYARSNQCVIANRTRRLVGELFELEDLGYIEAKGFADGVHAFAVLGRSEINRFEALRSDASRLVGRETETETLQLRWSRAREGAGGIALITGEAGVGKSRFAMSFAQGVDKGEAFFINCFCTPHSQQAALRPFVAHMRRLAGARDAQSSPTLDTLEAQLAPGTSEIDRHFLATLIGLERAAPDEVGMMTANQKREATIDALVRQLELLSRQKPVLVLVEDVHWADPSSLELLGKVLAGQSIGRTLVVVTGRPEVRDRWDRAREADEITLQPFGASESRALINQVLGGSASPGMVRVITERASGIALFIEELTKSILAAEAHVLDHEADTFELSAGFALPETLQDSLLARLDQLGDAKRVAQIAAVIGREFTGDEVRTIAPELGDLVEQGCDELRRSGLVEPYSGASVALQFRHVLIQEIAYSTLIRTERREYNARLLDALEAGAREGRAIDAERWAHYAWEAGRPARSVHYWLLAGQEALRSFAMKEAEARLRKGLELVGEVSDPVDRHRLALDLLLNIGKVLLAQVGHANPETGTVFDRCKQLAEELGDNDRLLAAMHGQQAYDLQLSRMRAARNRGNEMLALGEELDDNSWKIIGYRSRGIASFPLGDYAQSADDLLKGIVLLRKAGASHARELVADDLLAAMQIYASWSLVFLGETERGISLSHAACERAEFIRQPYSRAFAYVGRNYCQMLLQDFDRLEQGFKECISLCQDNEIWYFLLTEKIHHGHYLYLRGEKGVAAMIREGIENYRQTRSILYQPTYKHWEALAWLAENDDAQAREANAWAIETAEQYEMHHMLSEYYALKAVLDDREGKGAEAMQAIELAQQHAERQKAMLSAQLNRELWQKYGLRNFALG